MKINSDIDKLNIIKEIISVIGIWLCNVCIFVYREYVLISYNILK